MAFPKTLARRFFSRNSPKKTLPFSPLTQQNHQNAFLRKFLTPQESGENGFLRRLLQKRAIFQSAMPEYLPLPVGDKLIEKLKSMNNDRIRFDGLSNPPAWRSPSPLDGISIEDAKKILRISQMEMLKQKLRNTPKNCVSYSEFLHICEESVDRSDPVEVSMLAKMLDESGAVIVMGNMVFLRPDQVVKAIEKAVPLSIAQPSDRRWKELEKMEKEKLKIDERAETLVRRELWCGLGLLAAQTAAFMRLTFWELSWDVMEPICFYVTSVYFMAGYAFFLRTSKDPSFEGFFESRFSAKQKRLMKLNKFDLERFNELRRECDPAEFSSLASPHDGTGRTLVDSLHN